jgi:hypothetical protein
MTIIERVQFVARVEALRAKGQKFLNGLVRVGKESQFHPPVTVVEKQEENVRCVVAGNEFLLAMEIRARTRPEQLEGEVVAYQVKRSERQEELKRLGKVCAVAEHGETPEPSTKFLSMEFFQTLVAGKLGLLMVLMDCAGV